MRVPRGPALTDAHRPGCCIACRSRAVEQRLLTDRGPYAARVGRSHSFLQPLGLDQGNSRGVPARTSGGHPAAASRTRSASCQQLFVFQFHPASLPAASRAAIPAVAFALSSRTQLSTAQYALGAEASRSTAEPPRPNQPSAASRLLNVHLHEIHWGSRRRDASRANRRTRCHRPQRATLGVHRAARSTATACRSLPCHHLGLEL